MIFTQEQIDEISRRLANRGIRDSEISKIDLTVDPITGEETLIIVKNGENVRISIEDLYKDASRYIIYDVSYEHGGVSYNGIEDALGIDGANIPAILQRGGLNIKFIDVNSNQYVQYRLMSTEWSLNEKDWQGVEEEPTEDSDNLVKSGGIYEALQHKVHILDLLSEQVEVGTELPDYANKYLFTYDQMPCHTIVTSHENVLYYIVCVHGSGSEYGMFYYLFDGKYCTNIYTASDVPTWIKNLLIEYLSGEVAKCVNEGQYNRTTKKIILSHDGTPIVQIDATDFIKDGMVSDVQIQNGYLVITFNTDSGKAPIRIPISDIFNPEDYYTKVAVDNLLALKQNVISDLETIRSNASAGAAALANQCIVKTNKDTAYYNNAGNDPNDQYNATLLGVRNKATGYGAFAGGIHCEAGNRAAVFNSENKATGVNSFASGDATIASGIASHTEGKLTQSTGNYSHSEGNETIASGGASHSEGYQTKSTASSSHAEGYKAEATSQYSHAEGNASKSRGDASHSEGYQSIAEGNASHAEGKSTKAQAVASHTEGDSTIASGNNSHAEGAATTASGKNSHTEGENTKATGNESHAEGDNTEAIGNNSHAEGHNCMAIGASSHAEGKEARTGTINGGVVVKAGDYAHAEGNNTTASGFCSHTEGQDTIASGDAAHAEGWATNALGENSHAEGSHTVANNANEHAQGAYNKSNSHTIHSIGIGYLDGFDEIRKNAVEVLDDGRAYIHGIGGYDGTNINAAMSLQDVVNFKIDQLTLSDNTSYNQSQLIAHGTVQMGSLNQAELILSATDTVTDILAYYNNNEGKTLVNVLSFTQNGATVVITAPNWEFSVQKIVVLTEHCKGELLFTGI